MGHKLYQAIVDERRRKIYEFVCSRISTTTSDIAVLLDKYESIVKDDLRLMRELGMVYSVKWYRRYSYRPPIATVLWGKGDVDFNARKVSEFSTILKHKR